MATVIQFPMLQEPPIVWADISRYNASNPDYPPVIHFDFDKYLNRTPAPPMICFRGVVDQVGMDYEFEYNLAQCRSRNLPYTVYHVPKLWKSIPNQAVLISECINGKLKGDPLYKGSRLDIERNDDLSKNIFTGNAEKLFNQILGYTSELPWLYTRAYFWDDNTYPAGWMKEISWWVANYFYGLSPSVVPSVRPILPECIAEINNPIICKEWQFDTHPYGRDWGSMGTTRIDLSFYTWEGGTAASFQQTYDIGIVEPPPVVVPETPLYRVEVLTDLNVRRDAGKAAGTDPDDGTIKYGSVMPVYEEKIVENWQYPWGRTGGWFYMNPSLVRKTTKT